MTFYHPFPRKLRGIAKRIWECEPLYADARRSLRWQQATCTETIRIPSSGTHFASKRRKDNKQKAPSFLLKIRVRRALL